MSTHCAVSHENYTSNYTSRHLLDRHTIACEIAGGAELTFKGYDR